MMTTASQKFWALPEMQLEVAKYLEEQDFRSIIVTSRFNHKRFLADAWRSISGIGHLMAILHDDLAVHAVGRGLPEVKVPPLRKLDPRRVERFLMHAAVVQRLKVHSNPNRFVSWKRLDRLLELPLSAQKVVMPQLTHFSIAVGPKYQRVELAPFIKLCANPWLEQIWVGPNRNRVYPRSSLADAEGVFSALRGAFQGQTPLKWLAFYPEALDIDRVRRDALTRLFIPLSLNIHIFVTTIWFVSLPMLHALSTAPLERLEIQGRAPVPYLELNVNELILPELAFANLRLLLLQDVPLGFARHILMLQPLIDNVTMLRLQICDIDEIEEDEDAFYIALGQRLAAFPNLRELTFSSSRSEYGEPYPTPMTLLQPLFEKRLELLRLFRIGVSGSEGFQHLRYPTIDYWQNMRVLSIMHQDLTADDLIYLTRLPNLVELGGNVSLATAVPPTSPFVEGFINHLTFISQYRLRTQFRANDHMRSVEAIVNILDTVTPRGMTVLIDRLFVQGDRRDDGDGQWARNITSNLRSFGKLVPHPLEWVSA